MEAGNLTFEKYLKEAIGEDNAAIAFSAFDTPASVSVRYNPYKLFGQHLHLEGDVVPWSRYGRILKERPCFTLDPCFHSGAYYVQDSSSMFVGEIFRHYLRILPHRGRPVRVLDLCAAPGGKTTDIAASLREVFGDRFILVSNEVVRQRAGVLDDNTALWGDPNVAVTCADPKVFATLDGWFDIIVADVPCSGEGMFRKNARAVEQWSEDTVSLCMLRQRRIIADVWPALSPDGGILIYSTCTFNKYENDDNVDWIAENLGGEILTVEMSDKSVTQNMFCREEGGVLKTQNGFSLIPGLVPGEGQYCSAVRRDFQQSRRMGRGVKESGKRTILSRGIQNDIERLFDRSVSLTLSDGVISAFPEDVESEFGQFAASVRPLRIGCCAGTMKGKDFVPSADLALSYMCASEAFPRFELSKDDALSFLRRDAIVLPASEKGYVIVCYGGLPLGFVKNLGQRCNNLHPQSRRIRMNIL